MALDALTLTLRPSPEMGEGRVESRCATFDNTGAKS